MDSPNVLDQLAAQLAAAKIYKEGRYSAATIEALYAQAPQLTVIKELWLRLQVDRVLGLRKVDA
jgi:hypothetical protein